MTNKPRLLCAIPHSPAFDSCFPLLERLKQRDRVEPFILLGPRLRKTEPRTTAAVRSACILFKEASLLRLEFLAILDILRADAILTHSDPIAYGGKFRPRDAMAVRTKKPTVFVQHGMVQAGLHYAGPKPVWSFHAGLMLVWAPLLDPNASFFESPIANRLRETGLIKTNRLAPHPSHDSLSRELDKWDQRVLICHNYGFESQLYSIEAQRRAFSEWVKLANSRPNTLFILRSHRGKRHPKIAALIDELIRKCPNILLAERHSGLMRMATINDVLALVDRVITHPSTVVLDAIYDNKPVGIFNAFGPEFTSLPRCDSAHEIAAFLDGDPMIGDGSSIRKQYGEISKNLDIAAEALEDHLLAL